MSNRILEEYLNSIDYNMITDKDILSNIYKEIGDKGNELAVNQYTNTNLEKLVLISNAEELVKFFKSLDTDLVYKKLGSRIVESILTRLFECMYIHGEYFSFEEVAEKIVPEDCINSRNATHVLRRLFMLLSAKRIEKIEVTKFSIVELENSKDQSLKSNIKSNSEYAKFKLEEYKKIVSRCIHKLDEADAFTTAVVLVQCLKSQSLISLLIDEYCGFEHIKMNGYSYEAIASVANRGNLERIFSKIKNSLMDLCNCDVTSYFMRMFITKYRNPKAVYEIIDLEQFNPDSNIILSLLESLQVAREYETVDKLIEDFYKVENIFKEFLLSRYDTLDTKFIATVVNFMKMPEKHNYGVNQDFVEYFQKEWLKTKAGRSLIIGFVSGSSTTDEKTAFLNKNIDLLWSCVKWKDSKNFMKLVTEYTTGHSRKKAFEILRTL